jgi:hypothetical protein
VSATGDSVGVFRRRFGRPRPWIVAPATLLVTALIWVAVAKVSTTPDGTPAGAAALPSQSSPPSPSATPTGRADQSPRGISLTGSVLVQADGYRQVDLGTGRLSRPIGPTNYDSRVLRLPDGRFLCVCDSAVGPRELELRLEPISLDGVPADGRLIGRFVGDRDPFVTGDEQGEAVSSSAALSPDGRYLALAVTYRRDLAWRRTISLLDVAFGRLIDRLDLRDLPSNRVVAQDPHAAPPPTPSGGLAIHVWAPSLSFSPDSASLLVTTSSSDDIDTLSESSMLVPVGSDGFGRMVSLDGAQRFSAGICRDAVPAFGDSQTLFAICTDNVRKTHLRRVSSDGRGLGDIDLSKDYSNIYPAQLLDSAGDTLFLWDPFGWRAVRIALSDGKIEATARVRAGDTAASEPLVTLGRALVAWVAPAAAAKIWLQPALALPADATRLYLVVESGSPEDGPTTAAIVVLDARTLAELGRWTDPGEVTSIAVSDDGRFVYTTGGPRYDSSGRVLDQAAMTVRDAGTGEVVRVFDALGDSPLLFPDREAVLH